MDDGEGLKECPDCAELIRERAKVCKHCGWGRKKAPKRSRASAAMAKQRLANKGRGAWHYLRWAVLAVAVVGLWFLWSLVEMKRESDSRAQVDKVMGRIQQIEQGR